MKAFYGKELKDNQDVAVKIEIKNNNESNAINRIAILSSLEDINKISKFYFYEHKNNKNIIVETLYEFSLKIFLRIMKKFLKLF